MEQCFFCTTVPCFRTTVPFFGPLFRFSTTEQKRKSVFLYHNPGTPMFLQDGHNPPEGEGALIFSLYVGSDPVSTVYPKILGI